MTFQIIIKGKNTYGKTRAEQEANLRKEGYVGMSDSNFDKCKWIEKKRGFKQGFLRGNILENIK